MKFDRQRAGEYLRRHIDELSILTVLAILHERDYAALDTQDSQMVVEAIKRSTNELGPDVTLDDVSHYVQNIDHDSLPGFISNVKGIYHEMEFAQSENADHDAVTARLHADTNHPGSDIVLVDHNTGQVEEVQLKAVQDTGEVYHALERYPDVPVYVTDEVAGQIDQPGVYSSGFSNQQLTSDVENTVHHLVATVQTPLDYLPHTAIWSTALAAAPVVQAWSRGYISRDECLTRVAGITGWKVVKVASILALLSFPLTAVPTSVYLIARLLYGVFKVFND